MSAIKVEGTLSEGPEREVLFCKKLGRILSCDGRIWSRDGAGFLRVEELGVEVINL